MILEILNIIYVKTIRISDTVHFKRGIYYLIEGKKKTGTGTESFAAISFDKFTLNV